MPSKKKQRGSNERKPNKGNPQNIVGQGFHTNPERINKKGRPPKLTTDWLNQMRNEGYTGVAPSQVSDIISILMQLPESVIKKTLQDDAVPYHVRLVIKHMNGNKGWEVIREMWDRTAGKPKQVFEGSMTPVINIESANPETKQILEDVRKKMAEIDEQFKDSGGPTPGS
jgi:hypothetical protein